MFLPLIHGNESINDDKVRIIVCDTISGIRESKRRGYMCTQRTTSSAPVGTTTRTVGRGLGMKRTTDGWLGGRGRAPLRTDDKNVRLVPATWKSSRECTSTRMPGRRRRACAITVYSPHGQFLFFFSRTRASETMPTPKRIRVDRRTSAIAAPRVSSSSRGLVFDALHGFTFFVTERRPRLNASNVIDVNESIHVSTDTFEATRNVSWTTTTTERDDHRSIDRYGCVREQTRRRRRRC